MRLKWLFEAMAAAVLFVAPAYADTSGSPPGAPCLKNNGNPCNGNNGNLGEQGNANHEKVKIDKKPPPIDLAMPAVSGRGAYIDQIGDSNEASIVQTAPDAYAKIVQQGSGNDADVSQMGSGTAYAAATQSGDSNFARLQQSGTGQNVVYATQEGSGNWLWSNQLALGAVYNGARLTQSGDNNDMLLYQAGSDNLAVLTQQGDDNGMTAIQLGDGNRLTWLQQGDNLTDLEITQTGGAQQGGQLLITQTGVGNGN